MGRISFKDSSKDAILKMVDGNPGALRVCMEICKRAEEIDPDAIMGGIGIICFLDTLEIYGSSIWGIYKDVCREDIVKTIAVIRAVQLGIISKFDLVIAIENYGKGIDLEKAVAEVRTQLPAFSKG